MKYIASFAVILFFFEISMLTLSNEKIDFKNKRFYIGYLISLFLLILNFEFSTSFLRLLFNVLIYIILAKILITKNIRESILLAITATVLMIFVEAIYGIIAYPMLSQKLFENEEAILALINNFFIGIILLSICHYSRMKNLYRMILSATNKISDRQVVIFSLFIVFGFNLICWISYFVVKGVTSYYYLTLISSLLSVFSIVLVFFYFKINNKYLTVYEKYNVSLESVREFEKIIENYKINTHENKNQFRIIRNMSKNKKIISYIDALLGENVNDDEKLLMDVQSIPTGGLRGILYSKLLVIKEQEISFDLVVSRKINYNLVNSIDDYTLTAICRILGVLLDNAIEEVKYLKDKYIMIELYDEDSNIVISITNNYEGYVDIDSINNPGVSTKGKTHGYGLSLVQKLVRENKKIQHSSEFFEDNFMQKIKIKV